MHPRESASLAYRDGDCEGWYLDEQLIAGSKGRDTVDVLDDLTRAGWKLTMFGAISCLERPKRFGAAAPGAAAAVWLDAGAG
jgi:hypothetical protein